MQGDFAALPIKAFPLGGRWLAEGQTDEGAMTERFRFLQGEFRRLRAASDFLDAQKVTKKALGGGANRIRLRLILHDPHPLEPPLRGLSLGTGRKFPARKI